MAQTIVSKQAVIDSALDVNHPERTAPVYEPKAKAATSSVTPAQLAQVVVTEVQAEAVKLALRLLTSMDQDYASGKNHMGFNKVDALIGHSLAEQALSKDWLSPKQLALGLKLVKKYHGQLPVEVNEALKEA
jgi:hypothetical protein